MKPVRKIDLSLILRYVFNGSFLCLALSLCAYGFGGVSSYLGSRESVAIPAVAAAFFASLIFGALAYSIYRAVVFPVFYIIVLLAVGRTPLSRFPQQFWKYGDGARLDVEHWQRLMDDKSPQRFLSEWGGQVHLLGCSGVSAVFSSIVGRVVAPPGNSATQSFLFFGLFLIACCLISTARYQFRILEIEKKPPTEDDKSRVQPLNAAQQPVDNTPAPRRARRARPAE